MVSKRLWPQKYLAVVTRNINCIPNGVYVIEEADRASISLSVERLVYFGIIAPRSKDIQLIPRNKRGLRKLTGIKEFLDGYYELMKHQRSHPIPTLTTPFTYCMIDPSIVRDIQLH